MSAQRRHPCHRWEPQLVDAGGRDSDYTLKPNREPVGAQQPRIRRRGNEEHREPLQHR